MARETNQLVNERHQLSPGLRLRIDAALGASFALQQTIASLEGMARPQELAGGIGQALITTLLGLVVAIPTMVAFSYFRNKIDSLVSEVGKRIEQIMTPLGRKKHSGK